MLDPIMTKPWHHVSEWFPNDKPTPFYTTHGSTLWDYTCHEPKLNHLINDTMSSDAQLVTNMVVRDCKRVFKGFNSLVDIDSGTGTVAKAIVDAFPHLKCIVFDLPHVVADLKGTENLIYAGGDMFEGRERNEKEWAKLFFDAGFNDYKIAPVLGLRYVIEVYA
ncbi:unnamed protein product [Ilex paraguariensis]|uniref:O-methyltransferase C-terminal domain-containing protein n=1 Tax=Ilex paraguariensis TaxID=185542 RepID=A0ABC8R9F9_9AQUA